MDGRTTLMALCILTVSFQVLGALANGKAQQLQVPPPAIFVFGDGAVDVGNNNYLEANDASEPVQANHPFYDIDFPNSKATGRFSNGYNLADFIATKSQMKTKLGNSELKKLLSNSIFLLDIGAIDIFYIWNRQFYTMDDNETNIPNLITSYGVGITALYNMGARKFVVINAPPMGSAPVMAHLTGETWNMLAMEFNDGLKSLLTSLTLKLNGLHYSIADFYGFSNATFMNPSAARFVDTVRACCKGSCTPKGGSPCQNRKQYWFWDDLYITEQAAKLAAAAFYDGPAQFTVPINFKKLVQGK
ncbi:hypothetical protein PR202_gb06887 [Eleusine coracana subsp. coracana]|uniref:GDSL esterase/lipase n=1 Tax=Eleusine coracana subsp. coracana TaxID=191504 RepID=A0AAV5EAL2_ELECO|nr:hypothetical protein PR202_gb06887 [Eleusine coracana subsp. coracana]